MALSREPGGTEEVKDDQKYGNGNKVREQFRLEIKKAIVCWAIVFKTTGQDGLT